jgi:spermidine/putrescine transport system substrate-binding protein
MRRRTFFLSLSGLAGCTRSDRPRLNVLTWSNYAAKDTIPDFEREFGATVRLGIYESNEEMLARVQSGNSGWDIVTPSNYFLPAMQAMDLLGAIDTQKIANATQLQAEFQQPSWDPALKFSVPFMWGSTGIAYRAESPIQPTRWADLSDPTFRGRVTMLDDPTEVFAAALAKLQLPLNSNQPAHLKLARDEAIRQKKALRAYLNAEVRDQLVAGDILAAQLWATTAGQASDGSSAVKFVHPKEGYLLYMDCLCVLRESRRSELAHQFINYLLRAKVSAAIATETWTASANAQTKPLLPVRLQQSNALFPDADTLARGVWTTALNPEAHRLRDRYWTEIKNS